VAGAKIWVDNKVDFSDNRNLIVAAITLVLGTGDFTLRFGKFRRSGLCAGRHRHRHLRWRSVLK
jgi:putative pyrimidine permease RutG